MVLILRGLLLDPVPCLFYNSVIFLVAAAIPSAEFDKNYRFLVL
jgi:hypothetical protein